MSAKKSTRYMNKIFARRYSLEDLENASTSEYYMSRLSSFFDFSRYQWMMYVTLLLGIILTAGSVFYYNLLVTTEQDVLAARGKVDAYLQRRNDISINLSKAVFDYSKHEQGVFTAVVALRSFLSKNAESNDKLKGLFNMLKDQNVNMTDMEKMEAIGNQTKGMDISPLARLMAVAEQYPDLKLSTTFLNLMSALIDVEKDLATERIKYNEAVNVYTTNMAKFPINMYAGIFNFNDKPYFKASNQAQKLIPIGY